MTAWVPFSNNLTKNAQVSDLEIVHDADCGQNSKLNAATYGRGLWVTNTFSDTNNLQLTIYGNVESHDSLFALLGKYCKNMHLGKRNTRFTYPIALENVPEHFYFTALNVLLCE